MDFISSLKAGILVHTPEEMEAIGERVAALVPENIIIKLQGDLGVGKTTFVRGLARAWGITQPVTSPSFGVYNLYVGQRQLAHVDGYRLGKAEDVKAWMLEDFLEPPYCIVVEWPEKVDCGALPGANCWEMKLWMDDHMQHWVQLLT